MTDDQIFETWNKSLDAIFQDIQWLLITRHIFREVRDIIQANPQIQKPSSFYEWMATVYSAAAPIAVRRQVDRRRRTISFARLLDSIQRKPKVLSRARFVSLYSDPVLREQMADRDFDKFAGPGNPYVDRDMVRLDLEKLMAKAKKVKEFADTRVAHYSQSALENLPTFADLDDCIVFMEKLLKKYLLLFRAQAYLEILPVWQYDWKEIFREPWIRSESK